jgi:hypothetical protein
MQEGGSKTILAADWETGLRRSLSGAGESPGERAGKMKNSPGTPARKSMDTLEIFLLTSAPNILNFPLRIAISSNTPPNTSKLMATL